MMDLSQETNVEKLKALAYDQLVLKEQADSNLRLINQRINDLLESAKRPKDEKTTNG